MEYLRMLSAKFWHVINHIAIATRLDWHNLLEDRPYIIGVAVIFFGVVAPILIARKCCRRQTNTGEWSSDGIELLQYYETNDMATNITRTHHTYDINFTAGGSKKVLQAVVQQMSADGKKFIDEYSARKTAGDPNAEVRRLVIGHQRAPRRHSQPPPSEYVRTRRPLSAVDMPARPHTAVQPAGRRVSGISQRMRPVSAPGELEHWYKPSFLNRSFVSTDSDMSEI